jgi:hypothetical protein
MSLDDEMKESATLHHNIRRIAIVKDYRKWISNRTCVRGWVF